VKSAYGCPVDGASKSLYRSLIYTGRLKGTQGWHNRPEEHGRDC
jgi:hypothetical protein